ncbi:hypothetical protein GCM10010234_66850 [Streptomyces hawaiiensis]
MLGGHGHRVGAEERVEQVRGGLGRGFALAVGDCGEEAGLDGCQVRDQGLECAGVDEAGSGVSDEHDHQGLVAGDREVGVDIAAPVHDRLLGAGVREAARAGQHQQVGLGAGRIVAVIVRIDVQRLIAVAEQVEAHALHYRRGRPSLL